MSTEYGFSNLAAGATADDDAALLGRVIRGDETAMEALYDRYSRVVYSVALRVLRDASTAEDVLQEIFMQVWRTPDSFASARGSLVGWLAIVARNRAVDTLRRKRPSEQVEDVLLARRSNLSDESQRKEFGQQARAVIAQWPLEQRKTLEMAFFDGLTHYEIAEMTGQADATVQTSISNSLQLLRKALAG